MGEGERDVLISICIPVHGRTHDLKQVMPHHFEIAAASPPVEISILDYNSPDDLREYMESLKHDPLAQRAHITYLRYTMRDYYHMAHARNMSVKLASGEYIIISSADLWFDNGFIPEIRERIAEGCVWMGAKRYCGVLAIRRDEFIAAGGFDERFEFYGPEDRDLLLRMQRRGAKFGALAYDHIHDIPTPNSEKVKNYRLKIGKRGMADAMHPILYDNIEKGVLVANKGREWGQWS